MKIQEIIAEIKNSKSKGFQLIKKNRMLTSTWLFYKKDGFYYYFDINQKIKFIDAFRYSEKEVLQEFENSVFEIDLTID